MSSKAPHARTFEFWLGRAGSGKSRACLDAVARQAAEQPRGKPLLLLVPEQASAETEYALATAPGMTGYTRARVVSFRLLRQEAFRRVGGKPRRAADPEERVMLMRQAIRRRSGELRVLGRSSDLPGLAETVSETLLEFQRYGWNRGVLSERLAALEAEERGDRVLQWKLGDLIAIWEGYEGLLAERGLADEPALAQAAARALREWDELEGAQVWIDGFISFTTQELILLEALLEHADDAALALTLDPSDPAFQPLRKPNTPADSSPPLISHLGRKRIGPERTFESAELTYGAVRKRMETLSWHVREVEFPLADAKHAETRAVSLVHLESRVLTRLRPEISSASRELREAPWPHGPIELVQAADPRAEIEAVARRIAALCSRDTRRFAWRAIAVLARDLGPYAPLVRELFPRYGIPFFLDARRSISSHPLSRLLLAALDLISDEWRAETVLDYLKTSLTPLQDAAAVAKIENLAGRRRLRGFAEWMSREKWSAPARDDEDEVRHAPLEESETARLFEQFHTAMRPLLKFRARLKSGGAEPASALWEFLDACAAAQRLEEWIDEAQMGGEQETADIHRAAWEQVVALLERINEIGGGFSEIESPSPAQLAAELRELVETGLATVDAGLIPSTLDQVVVGSADRSRVGEVKAAFVIGLVDGQFPLTHEEDPMLGDRERALLEESGRELGPNSERRFSQERYFAYMALTRATEYLCLSYPRADAEGKAAAPSSVFRAVAEAFPSLQLHVTDKPPLSEGADEPILPEDWVREISQAFHRASRGENPAALGEILLSHPPRDHPRLLQPDATDAAARLAAPFAALGWPKQAELPATLAEKFWEAERVLTVTSLESYALCPFQFFARRMLRLAKPSDPIPGPKELGQLRHHILDRLFTRLKRDGALRWGDIDLAEARAIVEEEGREGAERALADHFGRDALTDTVVRLIIGEMQAFAGALKSMGERYGFAQVRSEFRFGPGDAANLKIDALPNLSFVLRGSVDRVDQNPASGDVVVFDYKSGGKSLNPARLYHGVDLQLPAYALAAEKNLGRARPGGEQISAHVSGMFYWPLTIGVSAAEGERWAEPGSPEWFRDHRPIGLFDESIAGDLDTRAAPGDEALAFKFKLKKDGGLSKQSPGPLEGRVLRSFLDHTHRTMSEQARGIASGKIEIRPWKDTQGAACDFCDYIGVCRLQSFEPSPWRSAAKMSFKDFPARLDEGGSDEK